MRRIRYDVPRWHVFQHREARGLPRVEKDDSPELALSDEVFDRLYAGSSEPLSDADEAHPMAAWATKLHEVAEQLPAFERLSQECAGDADAAGAAVETLMEALRPHMQQDTPNNVPDAALRKAIGQGCEKASGVVEEQRDMKEALEGVGLGAGTGTRKDGAQTKPTAKQLAARLRHDDRLRRIALLAGKFKRVAARKQKAKVRHGADEVTDVEQGNAIERLLPVELSALMHPRRKLALMRDLLESRAMQYRLEGRESLGKGPVVVCIDKSGSMAGPQDEWATAVALALMDVAQRQRRPFALLAFDGDIKHEVVVKPSEPLPEAALFTPANGGTNIGRVLVRSLEVIAKNEGALKKADVVLITDGDSSTESAPHVRQIAATLGVTILGVGIGVSKETLAPWCDEAQSVTRVDDLDDRTANALFSL